MAAIGPKIAFPLVIAALFAAALRADETTDALAAVNRVATALAANNPAQAIAEFDRSFAEYDQLKSYFIGLTNAYNLTNEAMIVDERTLSGVVYLDFDWTITVTRPGTLLSTQRKSKVQVRVVRKKNRWRIAGFSPISIFDPAFSWR